MTESLQQYLSRGGTITKCKRGASAMDALKPIEIRQVIHAQTVQVARLRKRAKK